MSEFHRALRFMGVGLVNTLLGFGCILMAGWWGASPAWANVIGFAFGLVLSYGLHRRITFEHRGPHAQALTRFAPLFVVAYLANQGVLALSQRLWPAAAVAWHQALAVGTYAVLMFVGMRWLVFANAGASGAWRADR